MRQWLAPARRRRCPQCGQEMEPQRRPPVARVDHCPACHGLWLVHGDLKQLLHARFSERADPRAFLDAERTELLCPDCKRPLFERRFMPRSDIRVHQCVECAGIFLEAGKLERLRQLVESLRPAGGAAPRRPERGRTG